MLRRSIKAITAVTALSAVLYAATPAFAAGCAQITGMNVAAPWTFAGGVVGVGTAVTNCVSKKSRYMVVHSFTSACGQSMTYNSNQLVFGSGGSMIVTTTLNVPAGTCSGVATVTAKVYDRSTLLSSASTPLTIQ